MAGISAPSYGRKGVKVFVGCVLWLLVSLSVQVRAQDTAFWFVAPHMSETLAGNPSTPLNYPAFLAISNATGQEAHVTITRYNGANASLVNNATIAAGALYKLDFTTNANMKTIENPRGSAGSVTEFGIHITSDVKVTAYYMHNHTDSRDIFTLKGRQALGTSFYVPMQSDNAAQTGTNYVGACDQIDIVATEDNTSVTVVPKARIRIGTSGSSNAGTQLTYALNKGQTLKIMEYTVNSGSLAGTSVTATKPVAITVTEDLVSGDTSGDQIVPVNSLGTRYVVPRGYCLTTSLERFYLVGTANNTTVRIYYNASNASQYTSVTLQEGELYRYNFPTSSNAVFIESSAPVYCYQRTGYNEEGAALLPSIYSIGQNRMSYYQVQGGYEKGFLVFRAGAQNDFKISYGSISNATLNVGTVYDVPNLSTWKVARFDLPSAANNQSVTIQNAQSPFSFGYIAANYPTSNMTCYGYLSAFGEFEFADTTYICASNTSVTLDGGYAMSYLWTFPDGITTATTPSITATEEGEYTLVMNQDPNIVTATTVVRKVSAGAIGTSQTICLGTSASPLTETSPATGVQGYQWQSSPNNTTWTNITGATSPTYSPGALTATTYFRRVVTNASCGSVSSNEVCVTVIPTVTVNAIADTVVCVQTNVAEKVFTSPVTGATFVWENSNPSIGLSAGGVGNLPAFTAQNPGVATITVTPSFNNCTGTPLTFTLTVSSCVAPVNPHLRSKVD
ncbi:MAG: hypothetical protein LBQ73_09920 [Tannerellaceae bacterium]|nr:hypothetical protein [Tannerellaceae bacterium]